METVDKGLLAGHCAAALRLQEGGSPALSGVGRKVAEKVNLALGEARGRGLLKFTGGESPAQRVVLRLRWDSSLAATNIEVRATGGEVEMQGNVPTSQLRARAIEIAQNTVGVEHVHADKLYVSPAP